MMPSHRAPTRPPAPTRPSALRPRVGGLRGGRRLLLAVVALVAGACSGGSDSAEVDTGERPELPRSVESAASPLPDVAVWDVSDAEWVQFADALPSDKPVLFWFWAPHCPACAAEAGDMAAFAEANADTIEVIGIGTQDDPAMAAEFVERHGIEFQMLWDESFETWSSFGITSQPASALFSADGESLGGWPGVLQEDEVLELVEVSGAPA